MKYLAIFFSAIALAGCAGIYTPLIDGEYEQADLDACRTHAKTVSPLTGAAVGAGVGAGAGFLMGAVVGAVFGVDDLAAKGAALGGARGGMEGLAGAMARQLEIVDNCMSGRGYKVL